MVASYSLDLRGRIMQCCDQGGRTVEVAERFAGSTSFVRTLKQRRRATGRIAAYPKRSGPPPQLQAYEHTLRALIKAPPDATLAAFRARLGVEVHLATLWDPIDRLGVSVKKTPPRQRATARRRTKSARRVARKPPRS